MNVDKDLKNSRFLTKEDCDPPIAVTFDGQCNYENVAPPGMPDADKWVVYFNDLQLVKPDENISTPSIKPLVLNNARGKQIKKFLGSADTDTWTDKKVVLFHDESVMMAARPLAVSGCASMTRSLPKTPTFLGKGSTRECTGHSLAFSNG